MIFAEATHDDLEVLFEYFERRVMTHSQRGNHNARQQAAYYGRWIQRVEAAMARLDGRVAA